MMGSRIVVATAALSLCLACSSESTPSGGGGSGGNGGSGGSEPVYADPYSIQAFDQDRIVSDQSAPNFHDIFASVDFHDGPFAAVTLVIDLDSTCYPFESWQDNPPPAGQNWPADCDAFDRNFEWSLDNPKDDPNAPPGLELVRAITPFGGPLHLEVDITDVANAMPGEHELRAHISTWSDGAGQVSGSNGGWTVSARIEVTPGAAPRNVLAVVPLYFGSQTDDAGPDPIAFTAPAETVAGRIDYRVTGHGGGAGGLSCIGPAEEFCKRDHTVAIDSVDLPSFVPWRTDCADLCTLAHYGPLNGGFDYCQENPCGAIQSVEAPRANWCPGSLTPPFFFDEAALGVPGEHTFDWTIANVADGGSWVVSATYIAYGP